MTALDAALGQGAATSFGHLPEDEIARRNQGSGGAFGAYYKPLFEQGNY
jgi:hypothetical protein